jgi:hypothetical protein
MVTTTWPFAVAGVLLRGILMSKRAKTKGSKQGIKIEPLRERNTDSTLDSELEDSFPASDPPQSTQVHSHVGGPDRQRDEVDIKPREK